MDNSEIGNAVVRVNADVEEGGLYAVRRGKLEPIPRNDEEGLRKVRITEEAFSVATEIGRTMRSELRGYRPDVSLVVSALVLRGMQQLDASKEAVRQFVLEIFEPVSHGGDR